MSRLLRTALLVAAGFAAFAACRGPDESGTRLEGTLVVTGSSTIAPVVSEIAAVFETRYPGVRVDVQSGGSSRGIADSRSGVADIGMASRALADDERDLAAHTIAHDGVTLIVNADNPVTDLTDEQVAGIYTGAIADWSQVGGLPGPITVVHKAAGRATRDVFLAYFSVDERDVVPDVVIGENEHGVKTVAGNAMAIGYVSIGTALADLAGGVPIRLLSVAGVDPDLARVADGDFPLSRPLLLVTGSDPSILAQRFIEFACSDEVAPMIRAQHFVPMPHTVVAQR